MVNIYFRAPFSSQIKNLIHRLLRSSQKRILFVLLNGAALCPFYHGHTFYCSNNKISLGALNAASGTGKKNCFNYKIKFTANCERVWADANLTRGACKRFFCSSRRSPASGVILNFALWDFIRHFIAARWKGDADSIRRTSPCFCCASLWNCARSAVQVAHLLLARGANWVAFEFCFLVRKRPISLKNQNKLPSNSTKFLTRDAFDC